MENKTREEIRAELYKTVVLTAPTQPILDMLSKIYWALGYYDNIMVGISGGSDSDTMLDAIHRLDFEKKVTYVYFGTGLEYEANKKHLRDLEEKYQIKIETLDPVLPIPTCCRKYGVPFWSKHVSEMIYRLQRHGFKWEDKPFDVLIQEYPPRPRCPAVVVQRLPQEKERQGEHLQHRLCVLVKGVHDHKPTAHAYLCHVLHENQERARGKIRERGGLRPGVFWGAKGRGGHPFRRLCNLPHLRQPR